MSTPNRPANRTAIPAAILAAFTGLPAAVAQERPTLDSPTLEGTPVEGPTLGVPATPEQIAGWALTILPDGTGLPPGSGDAVAGADVYARKCLACHGAEGGGSPNDRLVGGHGSLSGAAPVKTIGSYWPYATTVFDYIRRAMPFAEPQSLTNDEVYAVTAYLLAENGIIDEREELDAETLPRVRMPNADGFEWAFSPSD